MILTRSPYYLTIPWISPSSATVPDKYILNIYAWTGLKASVPASPIYQIENINPLGRVGNSEVDVSNYLSEFIDINLVTNTVTSIENANSLIWVKTEVIYYIAGVAQSPEFEVIDNAVMGYGYGIEGKNFQISSTTTLSNVNFANVSNNTTYLLPILISETVSVTIDVVSLPDNVINDTFVLASTTDSSELIKSILVKCSEIGTDTSVQIKYNDVVIHTLILKEEKKYTPIDVTFVNKAGQLQTTTFFKDKVVNLSVTNESLESSSGQPIDGVHQFIDYNTNGKTDFKISTGWVKESYNEILKQMMLSNSLWELKDNIYIPINLKKKSIQYQTRQRDRLLNYEFEFSYGFSEINNV